MAEYGDYEKEIKTLGDLRTFVNETLKGIEDNYTFDIDDDFMGLDIILKANCDVSYSEKSFYWYAKVNYVNDVVKVINNSLNAKYKIKALEIIKEKYPDVVEVKLCNNYEHYKLRMSSKHDTEIVKIDWNDKSLVDYLKLLTEEEFNLLKEILE